MAKLPEPPARLTLPALTQTLAAGTLLWRVYFTGGAHPAVWNGLRFFGPTAARFDHHDDPPRVQARGILYAAREGTTCLAEVFQATRVVERVPKAPWLVGFALERDVLLLDLAGLWPTQAGASMAINSGPRPRARRWSRRIHAAYPDLDGLLYASSMHANKPAVALYERAARGKSALPVAPVFSRALADSAMLRRLSRAAAQLGYGLV